MTGMTDWTVETLRVHFEQRFLDQQRAVDAALSSAKEAVTKAEAASEKRFEGVNEFRATLSDQAATFITRTEHNSEMARINEQLADLKARQDKAGGTLAGMLAAATLVISVVVVLANVLAR